MPNFRVTDSGDVRVLENGSDFRIVDSITYQETFAVSGVGSLDSEGVLSIPSGSTLSSDATFYGFGPRAFFAEVYIGFEEFVRETDTTDIRITESGDTRITDPIGVNVIEAMAYFDATYVPFSSNPYVKNSSVWSEFIPYVKHNGSWVEPERVSVKEGGIWKRVY